jgi:hypothetical protein
MCQSFISIFELIKYISPVELKTPRTDGANSNNPAGGDYSSNLPGEYWREIQIMAGISR